MLLPVFAVAVFVGMALLARHAHRAGTGTEGRLGTGRRRWLQVILTVGHLATAVGLLFVLVDAVDRDDLFDGIPMLVGGGILGVGLLIGLAASAELEAGGSRAARHSRRGQAIAAAVAIAAVVHHQVVG